MLELVPDVAFHGKNGNQLNYLFNRLNSVIQHIIKNPLCLAWSDNPYTGLMSPFLMPITPGGALEC